MITIVCIGKKHESWVSDGIARYEKRLKKPYDVTWRLLPHSSLSDEAARVQESSRLLEVCGDDFVVLCDERGVNVSTPELSQMIEQQFTSGRSITIVIGGAYGVDERVLQRADMVWSLSRLVFPHQLVRLIVAEQLYRSQSLMGGHPYHHT